MSAINQLLYITAAAINLTTVLTTLIPELLATTVLTLPITASTTRSHFLTMTIADNSSN